MDNRMIIDRFIAGYVSGISLVFVGHPFDTIKVKMQVMHGQSMLQTVKKTFTDEGIKGFYRGMSTPLVFTGTINMILFGMQMNLVEMIKIYEKSKKIGVSNPSQLSSNTELQMKAAIVSGFFISPIVTVMEGVKVRLQTNKQYKSPIDVVKRVYKESGIRHGIMRGWLGVALCRMSNYSYFGAFAFFTTKFENMVSSKQQHVGKPNISSTTKAIISVLAGGMAGCCYWLSCYPIDVIKNTIQAGSTTYPNETFSECAKRIYNTYGMKGFVRGLTPCLIRSFPANGAAFGGFTLAMDILNKYR